MRQKNKDEYLFTEEEIKARAEEMANQFGISQEELIKAYGSMDIIEYDLRMHKALEILKENN